MNLFYNNYLSKNTANPLEEMLKELSLFKQTKYCYNYIKKQVPGKEESEVLRQAEISSASFRQAFEFYKSAQLTYVSTSPLLYSYCINNLAKGLIYLYNPTLGKYFKKHGFQVSDENIKNNLLDSMVTIEKSGPPTAILKLLGNHVVEKQNLSFKRMIEHIPEVSDIYLKATNNSSSTAKWNNQGYYEMKIENWEEESKAKKEELEYFHLVGSYYDKTQTYYFNVNMVGMEVIRNTNSFNNFYYKDSLILPIKLEEGIHSINIMFYSYLIIMSYGMIVRYNADKWEEFIDPKVSSEATLINESLIQCVNVFISHVHKILFGYTYEIAKYSDQKVKEVINNSTEDIMKNINNQIKSEARRSGQKAYLPW